MSSPLHKTSAVSFPYAWGTAFHSNPNGGNKASIVLLEDAEWPSSDTLQEIASDINHPITVFAGLDTDTCSGTLNSDSRRWLLRYFTPESEIPLCGHGTLIASCLVFEDGINQPSVGRLMCARGPIEVLRVEHNIHNDEKQPGMSVTIVLPGVPVVECKLNPESIGLDAGTELLQQELGSRIIAFLPDEEAVAAFQPDKNLLCHEGVSLCVTAPASKDGLGGDFVSRTFCPHIGVDEDDATGSSHAMISPVWSKRLGKTALSSRQLSS